MYEIVINEDQFRKLIADPNLKQLFFTYREKVIGSDKFFVISTKDLAEIEYIKHKF